MTKKLLLAGIALGALSFGTVASAHELTYRATGPAGAITAGDTNQTPGNSPGGSDDQTLYGQSLIGLYLVAEESLGLAQGTVALEDTLDAGALPSGNTVLEVALTNATFGANFAATAIQGGANCNASFTVVRSSGGTAATSVARFIISNSDTDCDSFTLDVPVQPTSVGTVTVRTSLRTEGDNPIDGGDARLDVIFAVNAFQATFNGTVNSAAGAEGDDFALLNPQPTYTQLSDNGILGRLAIYVDERAQRDLTPGNFVQVTDVIEADVAVESTAANGFTAFDGPAGVAGNPTLEGTPADGTSSNRVVFTGDVTGIDPEDYIVELLSSKPNGSPFQVFEDGGVIASSAYDAYIFFTLDPTFYGDDTKDDGKTGDFESIRREGTNVILPWMNSNSIATNNRTNNTARLGNMSANDAAVSVALRNSNNEASSGFVQIGEIPAFGEFVMTAANLTAALGDFGRGDIEVVIEAEPSDITARRYLIRPEGITELSNGTVASEQTPNDTNDVP